MYENVPPLAAVAIGLFLIWILRQWFQTPDNIPPFPARPIPILGHLPYLAKDARGKIMEWSHQSGEIFSVYFGPTLVVVLSGYDILKDTIIKQANVFSDKPKTSMFPTAIPQVQGIIETSGHVWKENRSTVMSILRSFGMGRNVMAEKIQEEVGAYLQEIDERNGEAMDVKKITARAVSNIICNFLLGKRFEYDDVYYADLLDVYEREITLAGAGSIHMWFPWLKYLPLPGDVFSIKELAKNEEYVMKFCKEFIRKVKSDDNEEDNKDDDVISKENILHYYLQTMREKKEKGKQTHLSEEHLKTVITDLLVAGSETITTTLRWFFLYMIHYPHIQEKVYEEIVQEVGTSRSPNIGDKAKLTFTNATILETLRLSSIVPLGLFHRCTEETKVRGYTIPKDTHIMIHQDSVLLDNDIWPDANNFHPERFIDDGGRLVQPDQFIPFSLGPRVCLGEALAKAELFLFTTSVIQKYQVVPEDQNCLPSLDSVMGIACGPQDFKVKFIARN